VSPVAGSARTRTVGRNKPTGSGLWPAPMINSGALRQCGAKANGPRQRVTSASVSEMKQAQCAALIAPYGLTGSPQPNANDEVRCAPTAPATAHLHDRDFGRSRWESTQTTLAASAEAPGLAASGKAAVAADHAISSALDPKRSVP